MLIGARFFNRDMLLNNLAVVDAIWTRETEGQGTHTFSTTIGSFVPRATLFGSTTGTAKAVRRGAWARVGGVHHRRCPPGLRVHHPRWRHIISVSTQSSTPCQGSPPLTRTSQHSHPRQQCASQGDEPRVHHAALQRALPDGRRCVLRPRHLQPIRRRQLWVEHE